MQLVDYRQLYSDDWGEILLKQSMNECKINFWNPCVDLYQVPIFDLFSTRQISSRQSMFLPFSYSELWSCTKQYPWNGAPEIVNCNLCAVILKVAIYPKMRSKYVRHHALGMRGWSGEHASFLPGKASQIVGTNKQLYFHNE